MKGAILYKGKYGATRQYALWLEEELHLPAFRLEDIDEDNLSGYDYLVIGASIYVGGGLNKKWLKHHEDLLQNKKLFFFLVCGTPLSEKEQLEGYAKNTIPDSLRTSVNTWFLRGRMIMSKLSWKDRFLVRMGAKYQKDPEVKKRMLADFDAVKKENLASLIAMVKAQTGQNTCSIKPAARFDVRLQERTG